MSISKKGAQFLVLGVLAACGGAAAGPGGVGNTTANAPGGEPSVRSVDWMNRTYGGGEGGGYTVVDGTYEFAFDEEGNQVAPDYQPADPDAFVERGSFSVSAPIYGDVTGDGVEEAIIVSMEHGGGTGHFDGIDIYAMRGGEPVAIGSIPGGDRGDGGISDVKIEGGVIVVARMMSQDGDGACCPSKVQMERWSWKDAKFVEDESARKLEDFGE